MLAYRLVLLAAPLVMSLAAARAADWRTHSYDTDGFTVEFSGSVKVEPTDVNAETKKALLRSTTYMQDGGDVYVYLAAASQFTDGSAFDFAAGVKGTMDTYKCAKADSDTAPALAGGQAREIYASKCVGGNISVGAKFFMRGPWFYQVVYLIANDAQSADAKHFLDSFKLIPPKT